MTLFWMVSGNELFKAVLDAFYGGQMDRRTMEKCGNTTPPSHRQLERKTRH